MTTRVVVLGGGCGGVATAWALSRTPALRRRFEVTLVQPGWRLGGKGATGRDPARGHAILEHGLHLWLGFYRRAFAMMRDVYDAWDKPEHGPLRSLQTAFSPLRAVTLLGGDDAAPSRWHLRFPKLPGLPWDDAPARSRPVRAALAWATNLRSALRGESDPKAHATAAGLALAIARGLARDVVRDDGWARIDELDLRQWLRRHGASEAQADAPPVRALYDLGFAYPDGRGGPGRGAMAAGAGLKVLLEIFAGYRGAPFWMMNAGMGDTIFAPMHDVLRARGVRIAFFHRVDRLRVVGERVDALELAVQADPIGTYEPLVAVGHTRAWPAAPRRDRLRSVVDGDLEADDGDALDRVVWRAGSDFDDVVLAIPPPCHRRIAQEVLDADARHRAMVEHCTTVPTIAAQCWFSRTSAQLGWSADATVATGFAGSLRTWADLSAVLPSEPWHDRPAALAYACGVAPADLPLGDRAAATAFVRAALRRELALVQPMLVPRACVPSGALDEGAMHRDPAADAWDAPYVRVNVAAWERYVLTPPGSTRHRLAPDESRLSNLWLAGDWTRNAINGGSVEAAVDSGIGAAAALASRRP